MLEKLENAYLGILRTVVIVASGVLLIGVIMFGLSSLKGFGDGPDDEISPPEVKSEEIIKKMTAQEAISNDSGDSEGESTNQTPQIDPNKAYYDAASAKIVKFVASVSGGAESLDAATVTEITKGRADSIESEEIRTAYAKGFSESVDKVLSDKAIESLAKNSSGIDVVNQLLNTFTEAFNAQIEEEQEKINTAKQEHMQAKAESSSNLYIAAGCFGMFLLIVFLSIFIKIERNLRNLQVKNPVSA